MKNKEIARFYGISAQTVKNHISSILGKIGGRARVNITIWWFAYTSNAENVPAYSPDHRATANRDASRAYFEKRKIASGEGLSKEQWLHILEKYENKCLCCGATERISKDHVVPISKGGRHDVDNIQPLCIYCNARKGDKIIDYR